MMVSSQGAEDIRPVHHSSDLVYGFDGGAFHRLRRFLYGKEPGIRARLFSCPYFLRLPFWRRWPRSSRFIRRDCMKSDDWNSSGVA